MFALNAMAVLLPVSDNTEVQAMLGYSDKNFGYTWDFGMIEETQEVRPLGPFSTILLRIGGIYQTNEVSGFSARLGATGEMSFIVPGDQGVAASIERTSLASGRMRIGIVAGVSWSIHRRIRFSAYYWPYYYRLVKPENQVSDDDNGGPDRNYRCVSGISIPVILEIAVKPF
ncbi:MAG: hypothetical protein IH600_06365 [Bacteroidetes bacterium]|nr:hypothetical protein [Bacteroidota bacterium]